MFNLISKFKDLALVCEGPGHASSVLVVEDSPLQSLALKHWLGTLGYEVNLVSDGFEALSELQKERFYDYILVSCRNNPMMDGLELIRLVRELEHINNHYSVILGYGANYKVEECSQVDMDELILTPLNKQVLKSRLDYWAELKGNRKLDFYTVDECPVLQTE